MGKWYVVFLLLLLITPVYSARLYGAIYDDELNALRNTVVYINTSPEQRHISQFGGYSFVVNPGEYAINATLTLNNITRTIARETVTITNDGEYRLDLFLDEDINITQEFTPQSQEFPVWWLVAVLVIVVFVLGITVYFLTRARKKEKAEEVDPDIDPLKQKILRILKDNKGELTQKEIRKLVDFSQPKVSMTVTELVKEGLVTKTKKGRANIIRLSTQS